MNSTHTSIASSGLLNPVDITVTQAAKLFFNFTTLPVCDGQQRCNITFPVSRLSAFFPLSTFKNFHIDFNPYCLRTSTHILSLQSFVDL